MVERDAHEGDAGAITLERRWFASMTAVRSLQAECDALREVVEMSEEAWRRARKELAENAWRSARSQLVRLEALRDALGDELSQRDEQPIKGGLVHTDRPVSSAA